jgi:hypothetical protein
MSAFATDVAAYSRRYTDAGSTQQWARSIGLAAAVGIVYFLAARLSLLLLTKPDGVAVFWPASGVAAGVLIALGPRARLPVAAGAMVATIVANFMGDRTLFSAVVFGFCNAGEALLTAWLIERYFGQGFNLGKFKSRAGNARVRYRCDRGLWNWRDCRVPVLSQFECADSVYLATLVRFRCPWNHHGRTTNH